MTHSASRASSFRWPCRESLEPEQPPTRLIASMRWRRSCSAAGASPSTEAFAGPQRSCQRIGRTDGPLHLSTFETVPGEEAEDFVATLPRASLVESVSMRPSSIARTALRRWACREADAGSAPPRFFSFPPSISLFYQHTFPNFLSQKAPEPKGPFTIRPLARPWSPRP